LIYNFWFGDINNSMDCLKLMQSMQIVFS